MTLDTRDELLAGRYRKLETIGVGGMAKVYLARDERLGRRVAVKRLHAEGPEDAAERFEREARLGASLNHPNLVSIFDIATDGESVLIVMEYVDGETLKHALAGGRLGVREVLDIVRDVAAALDHAHGHGVVHRDVKPANILLRRDGTAKLADMGIATAVEGTRITRSGTVLGTAAYMAPEQLDGRAAGPAADVYSLATVAFEALTGQKARTGSSPMEVAHRVISDPPPDLRDGWPDAPPGAADTLRRAMAQRPEDRPASAGELVAELERELDERPRAAGPASAAAAAAVVPRDGGEPESLEAPPPPDPAEDATPVRRASEKAAPLGGASAEPPAARRSTEPAAAGASDVARAGAPSEASSQRGDQAGPPTTGESKARRREPDRSRQRAVLPGPPARAGAGASVPRRPPPARSNRAARSWLPAAAVLAAFGLIAAIVIASTGGGGDGEKQSRGDGQRQSDRADRGGDSSSKPLSPGKPAGGNGSTAGSGGSAAGTSAGGGSTQSGGNGSQGGVSAGGDPAALNSRGHRLMNAGRYDEAIPLLQQAVDAYPEGSNDLTYAYALYNLGRSLRLAGRPDEAVPILERRLRIPNQTATVRRELEAARRAAG